MAERTHEQAGAEALDLDKVRRHVRILFDISRLAAENSDLDRFLDQVVVQIARAVEISHVKILRYRPRESDLFVAAGLGWKEGVVRAATLSADLRSAPGRAFQTGEPVTITGFDKQEEYVLSAFLKEHGIVSLANVPLLMDGAAWGVLEVDSTTPRVFTEDTTNFLTAAGATIGAFLKRNRPQESESARLIVQAAEAQTRDVLLQEMQHRVKNNFQLILSSISMQKRRYPSGDAQQALDHLAGRINAISLAHDQLASGAVGQIVRLADYVRALCLSIRQQVEGIEIEVESDALELSVDRAVPLGLILNEVATNSIKHAFGPDGGKISVRLAGGVGYGEGRLTVSDNGRGMQHSSHKGTGLTLIASLARQMGGKAERESSERGTTTTVTFPLIS